MKRFSAFLKATTIGGLFILVPLMIVIGVVIRVVAGVREVARTAIEKVTPAGTFAEEFPLFVALVIVVAVSFFLGLSLVSRRGKEVGNWVERTMLFRIPGYSAHKAILSGLSDGEKEGAVRTGLLSVDQSIKCIVFVMEDHRDGWLTVFVPGTPNPTSGSVQFVRSDLVHPISVSLAEIGPVLQHWGVGMRRIVEKSGGLGS